MHPVIQSAVAAQHVKDMLDQAAEDSRVREARRSRPGRRWRRHAGVAATPVAAPVAATPVAATPVAATPVAATPVAAMAGAAHRGAAATQCCPD